MGKFILWIAGAVALAIAVIADIISTRARNKEN